MTHVLSEDQIYIQSDDVTDEIIEILQIHKVLIGDCWVLIHVEE